MEKQVTTTQPQVFSGITPAQFEKLIQKANASGIQISGNSGSASKFGVEITWNYSPETLALTLHCLHTPFFVKPAEVNAKIAALVKESLA
jgi:hypothetical protein